MSLQLGVGGGKISSGACRPPSQARRSGRLGADLHRDRPWPCLLYTSRFSTEIQNIAFVCHQDRCRGVVLQKHLIRQGLEVWGGRRRLIRRDSSRGHSGEDKRRGKLDEIQLRGGIQSPVEPGLARQRGKKVGRRANGLRAVSYTHLLAIGADPAWR